MYFIKTELRTRIRERSWSEPKLTARKKGGEKDETKDKPDWVDSLEND